MHSGGYAHPWLVIGRSTLQRQKNFHWIITYQVVVVIADDYVDLWDFRARIPEF